MLRTTTFALLALCVSLDVSAQQAVDPLNRAIVEGQSTPDRSVSTPRPDQRGTDDVPIVVKVQPESGAEKKARDDEADRLQKAAIDRLMATETQRMADYTGALAYLTVGLFFAAIAQAGLFFWQLRYMRQSVRDAGMAAAAAMATADFIPRVERAYLTGGGDVEDIGAGRRFRVEVANYGKTPAYLSDFDVRFATLLQVEAGPMPACCRYRFDDRIPPMAAQRGSIA
jgi:hypothetical protein